MNFITYGSCYYIRHAFATLSFIAEIFIFLYVGMDALDIEKWRYVSDRYHIFVQKKVTSTLLCIKLNDHFIGCP